jgi:hypothetical protein
MIYTLTSEDILYSYSYMALGLAILLKSSVTLLLYKEYARRLAGER